MPPKQTRITADIWPRRCPRCWKKKAKVVMRESKAKMEIHYQKRHPKVQVPDEFYTGKLSLYGVRIPPYTGAFPIGTKVRLMGFERPWPDECPICGKLRPSVKKMTKHYDKRHRKEGYPRLPRFFHEGAQIEELIDNGDYIIGKKGIVYSVTPAGYGGPKTPPIIHVALNRPIQLKYYDMNTIACLEQELELR